MTDTIQVVRVSDDDLLVGEVVFYPEDVIELTEEHPNRMVGNMEVVPGLDRRWVSGWEPVDEDS